MLERSALLIVVAAPNPENRDATGRYAVAAGALSGKYGSKPVARFEVLPQLFGASPARVFTMVSFPSDKIVDELFSSSEYKELIPMREQGFICVNAYVAEVPGGPEPFPKEGVLVANLVVPSSDGAAQAEYGQKSRAFAMEHGGTPLARYALKRQIVGTRPASFLTLTSFPNAEAATALFASADYAALRVVRERAFVSVDAYLLGR